jgi:hypothetical protein
VGNGLAVDAAWLLAALLGLIVVAAAVLATRRHWLERGGGTVECGLRDLSGRGGWRLGVVSYQRDELHWYGALGVGLRPEHVLPRRSVRITSRRPVAESEAGVLDPAWIVVAVTTGPLAFDQTVSSWTSSISSSSSVANHPCVMRFKLGHLRWSRPTPLSKHGQDDKVLMVPVGCACSPA